MRPTTSLMGAKRFALNSKMANKDFYKGTRQAFVPGSPGHRTGAPGHHVIGGSAKYRVDDDKVRFFVSPGIDKIESTSMKPYVSSLIDPKEDKLNLGTLGPSPPKGVSYDAWNKVYQGLSAEEKLALTMHSRRQFYARLAEKFGPSATAKARRERRDELAAQAEASAAAASA